MHEISKINLPMLLLNNYMGKSSGNLMELQFFSPLPLKEWTLDVKTGPKNFFWPMNWPIMRSLKRSIFWHQCLSMAKLERTLQSYLINESVLYRNWGFQLSWYSQSKCSRSATCIAHVFINYLRNWPFRPIYILSLNSPVAFINMESMEFSLFS